MAHNKNDESAPIRPRGQGAYTRHLEIALTQSFIEASLRLAKEHREGLFKSIKELQAGNDAVYLHNVGKFKGFHTSGKHFCVVCAQEGQQLLLFYVDTHDAAYAWGHRHKLSLVGKNIRLRKVEEEEAAAPEGLGRPPATDAVESGPLAPLRARELGRFGVGPAAAEIFRRIPDDDALLDVAECLQAPLAEALLDLAADAGAIEEVWRRYTAAREASAGALHDAIVDARNSDQVFIPRGDEDLVNALHGDFEAWRIFLHPTQRRIVEKRGPGAFKVSGGPGTGKSVVAVHRARFLAEKVFTDDPRPILVTAFNNSLAMELEQLLRRLVADTPELMARFTVRTLSASTLDLLHMAGKNSAFLQPDEVEACWQEAMQVESLGRDLAFYQSERDEVLVQQGAWTDTAYLNARRPGRPRLSREQRLAALKVFHALDEAMGRRSGGDDAALAREATLALRKGEVAPPFAAVVCDEMQDAGAAHLRFLAALTAGGEAGQIRADALFLCGDGNQRLYTKPVTLKSCGIDIIGRSATLKLNYRTTDGIRRAAVAVVAKLEADPLELETQDTLQGYRSLRAGPAPTQLEVASAQEEAEWIAAQAKGGGRGQILVLARTNAYVQALQGALLNLGLTPRILGAGERPAAGDSLVMCTLQRAKGLEAPRVIMAGAQEIGKRAPAGMDAAERAHWERREKCLRYVGMTRARDWCAVIHVR